MSALTLPTGKTALLVIDLQNDFLHKDGKFASGLPGRSLPEIAQEKNLIGVAAKVIATARAARVPIIHVKHAYRPDYADLPKNVRVFVSMQERQGLQDGSWGADFLDAVKPAPEDFVVTKTRVSAFYATSLEGILR
ncbi:MAG: cysteine hydrolase, partial [Deltaproteobacteria bacterium]|nr:cysteine hydrolase [Deltaproteobacteria bacterium]